MTIKTASDVEKLRDHGLSILFPQRPRVCVGMATCGLAAGAAVWHRELRDEERFETAVEYTAGQYMKLIEECVEEHEVIRIANTACAL